MLARYTKKFIHYLRHTRAVSALEYAILVGVVTVAMAVAIGTFTDDLKSALENIGDSLEATQGKTPSIGST